MDMEQARSHCFWRASLNLGVPTQNQTYWRQSKKFERKAKTPCAADFRGEYFT